MASGAVFSARVAMLGLAAALVCWPSAAKALVIDSFDGPAGGQALSIVDGVYQSQVVDVASSTGAVGDTRQVAILQLSPAAPPSIAAIEVNTASSTGRMVFASTAVSARTFVGYGVTGTDLGLDLSEFTELVFEGVSVTTATSLGLSIDVCCYTSSGYTQSLPAGFSGDVVFDLYFWNQVRLQNVADIEFNFWPSLGGNVTVEGIVTRGVRPPIPEPATAILLAIGLAGLVPFRPRLPGHRCAHPDPARRARRA